jgi:hypothetical protein
MHSSAIHDAYADVTPSALLFAAQRRQRLARMAAGARPDTPITLHAPAAITPPEPPPETEQEWADRQKQIPLPKEPWFSIVEEIEPEEPRRPSINEIQIVVARHYGVTRSDMLSARRTTNVMRPRQVGYYLSKKLTVNSLPQIGRRFGDRDHTSILSGIRKIERLLKEDAFQLAQDIQTITQTLSVSL